MNKKVSLFLILLFLFSLIVLPSIYVAQPTPVFSASAQWLTQYVAPGEKLVPLDVTLIYTGSGNATNVYIQALNTKAFTPYQNTKSYTISKMIPNKEYTFTFLVNVTPNIPLGFYNFTLEIVYHENNIVIPQYEFVSVELPVLGYTQLSAVAETSGTIFPGEQDVPIELTVYNFGNVEALNITLMLNSTYPIQFISKEALIPVIPSDGSASVQVLANIYSNATIGTYKVPITALVFGDTYQTFYMTFTVNSNQTVSGKLLTPLLTLSAGANQLGVSITLEMIYTGPVSVNSYSIQIQLPKGFTNATGGNVVYANGGALQPYQEFSIQFNVNIHNASLGGYTIPMKITWDAIEGSGVTAIYTQYMTFTLFLRGEANIEIMPSVSSLYAGEVNNITLIISNDGTGNLYNLSISVSSQLSILNVLPKINLLPAGQSITVPLEVYVPPNWQGSPAQFTVTITYLNSVYQQSQYQQEISLYVSSVTSPATPIIASLGAKIISPGLFTTNELTLYNTLNTTLYNLSVTISSPIYINTSVFNLPSLKPNSQVSIPITIYSPNTGIYSLSLIITYYEGEIQRQEQITVPVYVMQISSPSVPILVSFNSSTLLTGEVQYVKLVIQNTLNAPLYNVTISLSTQDSLYVNTTIITIPTLEPMQKLYIPVEVYTQSAGIVSASATITYYQDGQLKQTQEVINDLAAGSVNIKITGVTTIPTTAVRGGLVSVTATIYNFGTGPAEGLVVTVFPPRGITIVGGDTYYVGNLGADTSSTFTFAFRISNTTAPGTYIIPVEFTYTNDIGQFIHSSANITLTVSNSTSLFFTSSFRHSNSGNRILLISIAVIIIIIILVVALLLRKKRGTS